MNILNINIHFFPQSYGGATIVAEKLSYGLIELGHDVYNVCLRPNLHSDKDFDVTSSPFGPVIGINNIHLTSANRFNNPSVSSLLYEIYELIKPDKIIVHSSQHMGILAFLELKDVIDITTIVAHDYYWACLQGFRTLPSGKECSRKINEIECKDCTFYPGLTNLLYKRFIKTLDACECVVFPSKTIKDRYEIIYSKKFQNGIVLHNPDISEMIAPEFSNEELGSKDQIRIGYFGGPGYAKGWDIVRDLSFKVKELDGKETKFLLFDAGILLKNAWYRQEDMIDNMEITLPFHWSCAREQMIKLDAVLMPSRVQESYGLVAREALSLSKKSIIFPNGALSEITGFRGVYTLYEDRVFQGFKDAIMDESDDRVEYNSMSSIEYAKRLVDGNYR
jgi:glycosyltransferase involved in cell wall biosynthesis